MIFEVSVILTLITILTFFYWSGFHTSISLFHFPSGVVPFPPTFAEQTPQMSYPPSHVPYGC